MLFATFLSLFVLLGCQKEIDTTDSITVKGNARVITPYSFNWDKADYMPTPAGHVITVPWAYGATGSIVSNFDADVYSDHKATDGWVLVYSTFDPYVYHTMPYFILYNQYRGLLRIYQYNDNQGITTSSYLQSGLCWNGNGNGNNKVLNFLGTDVVDVNDSNTLYTTLEPDKNPNPVSPNKWYMLQYEIAYDPSITPSTSATPPTLSWYLNYYNITKINLGGTMQGSINGTVGSSTLKDQITSALVGGAKTCGTVGLSALGTNFFSTNKMGLPTSVFTATQKGVSGALSSATGNLPGAIVNIFSAIFGGNSNGQTYSLNLNATLNLEGSSTTSGNLLATTSIIMPGSAQSAVLNGTNGWAPLYNNNLGVFNLSNRPTVNEVTTLHNGPNNVGYLIEDVYTIDKSSFQIQWNPSVISIADIKNLTTEVILESYDAFKSFSGRKEMYGGKTIYASKDNLTTNYASVYLPNNLVFVRMSFNVVPKNGVPTSTIVKTFYVNVTQTIKNYSTITDNY